MALQHIRSSTLDKRPQPASLSDGQLAINTNVNAPGVFFKDSNGTLVKVGPTFVGTTAPNSTPGSGGASGNTLGEQWLDTSGGTYVLKIWDGSAWRSEAGEFVNVSGDTMTGALVMDNQQQIRFRETTANGTNYIALQAPASVAFDKTITLPDVTGTVVTTGDTGSVTSTMIADGTIVNADVNASAAIAGTKIDPDFGSQTIETTGVFSAAGGAAATPSITFTGDLNTGIYSPGADQIAISTNSSERIRIGANGEIGIAGANYGTSGQVLTSAGSGAAPTWQTPTATTDKIEEGNTSAEVIDTGSDGRFVVTTEGSERLRVTSAGLVGIGTTSPSFRLHSYDTAAAQGFFNGWSSGGTFDAAGAIRFGNQTSYQGRIDFDPSGNTNFIFENSYTNGAISWKINGGEKARLTPAGQFLVGTSTATASPLLGITGSLTANNGLVIKNSVAHSGSPNFVYFLNNADGVSGAIVQTGSTSVSYNTSSDYRLKENVVSLTGAANRLKQLPVHRFNFIAEPDKTVDGFLAHEAQAVVPECVTGTKDEVDADGNPVYQGIDQSKLVPLLTAALQEAVAKIESLEARLTAAGI